MKAYELDKRIKSTFVSLTLLQEIEKYLLDQGESQRKKDGRIKYSVTIYDKFGEECIDSFQNYHRSTLPNEARRINLQVHDYTNDFRIAVSFSRERAYSYLKVQVVGNSAKEKARGIAEAIESQLNEHKNFNFIFHSWISYLLPPLFGIAVGWTIPDIEKNAISIETSIGLLFIFMILLYFGLKLVKPYSVLDTNRNRQISSSVKWILNGLAGVFLFGLLATIIRKYLLGL
jgi:hypothetical protein